MHHSVMDHMILSKETEDGHLVLAVDELKSVCLSFPRLGVCSDDCLVHSFESVESLRMAHGVFWRTDVLVVASSVLDPEVSVHVLSVWNCANYFVVPGFLVNQLVCG